MRTLLTHHHQPDLVISDFAPTLRIATAGVVPHIAVGSGFVVLPYAAPLLALVEGATAGGRGPGDVEAALLDAVDGVRRESGGSAVSRVAALFRGDETFPASRPPPSAGWGTSGAVRPCLKPTRLSMAAWPLVGPPARVACPRS